MLFRCGKCPGCLTKECGNCKPCKDQLKRHGTGEAKRACIKRPCDWLIKKNKEKKKNKK